MPSKEKEKDWKILRNFWEREAVKLYHQHVLHDSKISPSRLVKLISETFTKLSDKEKRLLEKTHDKLSHHEY